MQENVYSKNRKVKTDLHGNNLTDEELVTLYLSTKADVYFEKLYDRYAKKVYLRCVGIVKDQSEAQDLTQEIFLKLFFRLDTFKGESKFCSWLFSVAYNQCFDYLRAKNKSRHLSFDDFAEGYSFEYLRQDSEEKSSRQEAMEAALIQLRAKERQILLLKYEDNLGIETIAQGFQVSQHAIKMRLLRSRETLRKIYVRILDSQRSSGFSQLN